MQVTYIYVYKLNNGCYYVGRTSTPHLRYSEHETGRGAAWTRLHGGAVLVECSRRKVESDDDAEAQESVKTLQLMQKYGWKKVRGGYFSDIDETKTAKNLRHHKVFNLVSSDRRRR